MLEGSFGIASNCEDFCIGNEDLEVEVPFGNEDLECEQAIGNEDIEIEDEEEFVAENEYGNEDHVDDSIESEI